MTMTCKREFINVRMSVKVYKDSEVVADTRWVRSNVGDIRRLCIGGRVVEDLALSSRIDGLRDGQVPKDIEKRIMFHLAEN